MKIFGVFGVFCIFGVFCVFGVFFGIVGVFWRSWCFFGIVGVFWRIWCIFWRIWCFLAYLVFFLAYLVFCFAYMLFVWCTWCLVWCIWHTFITKDVQISLNKLCWKQSLLRFLWKKLHRLEKSTPPPVVRLRLISGIAKIYLYNEEKIMFILHFWEILCFWGPLLPK